jgi:hypothetical protein
MVRAWYRINLGKGTGTQSILFILLGIVWCSCAGTATIQLARESYDEGILLRNLAKDGQAETYFKRTVSSLKSLEQQQRLTPEARLILGNCHLYLHEITDARQRYWSILQYNDEEEIDSEITGLTLLGLGQTYEIEGYPGIAGEFYETVLNNAKVRTHGTHPEAGIRWASVKLVEAGNNRESIGQKQWEKTVQGIIKKLHSIAYKFPSHAGLRQSLGNAYFVLSEGVNRELLDAALTQVILGLDIPHKPLILHRVLLNDFSIISQNILDTIDDVETRDEFRRRYLELSSRWNSP